MATTDPYMNLAVFNLEDDLYDYNAVANNWIAVGAHDHTTGKGVQIPTAGLQDGAVTDIKIASPVSAVRHLLLQASTIITPFNAATTNYLMLADGSSVASAVPVAIAAHLWQGDSGLAGQPQDFQVAHKTAYARVRATLTTNNVAPGTSINVGLIQASPTPGVGSTQIAYSFNSMVTNSVITYTTTGANAMVGGESIQFALPGGNTYGLAFWMFGSMTSQAAVTVTAQLYGYNG